MPGQAPDASHHAVGPLPIATTTKSANPFLKWAGGKRQLLPQLRRFVPARFGTYHEPFLGSGALFFDLSRTDELQRARLTDTNADLIGCYTAVRRSTDDVIDHLHAFAEGHRQTGSAHYYAVRGWFNETIAAWRASGAVTDAYPARLGAAFVYLNRTGFNGLFRMNGRGQFNVPAGRYSNPRICDEPTLRAAARALSLPGVTLAHAPWEHVLDEALEGDFVYFDPPYAPLSATARFTSYTAGGFTDADQRQLQRAVVALATRGCHVVLSNSTAPLIVELYEHDSGVRRAGLHVHRVSARRAINSNPDRRGDVMEFIVTTGPPRVEG